MTALKKYQRLEAQGLWRERPGAQARDVIVGLREATLVLSDPRSEAPLSQWSLPATQRLNPGQMPARFAPGEDVGEEVEIDDPEMIEALELVHRAIERRKPRPGRLRGVILLGSVAVVAAIALFWLPGQMKSYAARMLPAPTRADLGDLALADIARLTGQPCKSVPGRRAAAALAARLFPDAPPRIEILRDALPGPAHLPGDLLLIPARLVETSDSPDVIAGHLLVEHLRARAADPLQPLLAHMGLGTTLRLLTRGTAPEDAAKGYGEAFLAAAPGRYPPADQQLAAFEAAGVSSALYGQAARATNGAADALVSQDPFALGAPLPVLSDESWLELQAICSE
ncbi:hypothetical protein [Tabrizicola sp.]|uniref:hypothetical protein n=1 Tax=Tabrizicola sp. TaxID=2005166 RepID=UPI003D2852A0